MTTTAQPRVSPGVPSGGEFTAVGHSDQVPALHYPINAHEQAFIGLMSDTLDADGEAKVCRDAVVHSLISGDFGDDTEQVSALLEDDRLVRLAVDRFVVNESTAPGTHPADQTGQMLGRYLVDLCNEDLADAEAGLEWSE
ncbi:MAG TPA: hypothetical protein VF867_01285 [Arthrobacter sp.]